MERHGKKLAASHRFLTNQPKDILLSRLTENEAGLIEICQLLREDLVSGRQITPAGEWLLDNFHLVEEQINTARRHLPKGYSRELPCLAEGNSANTPRVYDIALEIISHGDGANDEKSLKRFITAYQEVSLLNLGELWAIPIMLRLALLENIHRVAIEIKTYMTERNLAASWADQMLAVASEDPKSLILVIADMARSDPPITPSFVSELVRKLQGLGPPFAMPLVWMEQHISEKNHTIEQLVQIGNQQQAANQVSISNCFSSLRFLGVMDWHAFVESMSTVDLILCEDIAGIYSKMDFGTRDQYRHVIERISRRSPCTETETAMNAIQLAQEFAARNGNDHREAHVGYYLIGKGLPQLEKKCKFIPTIRTKFQRILLYKPLVPYLSGIGVFSIALTTIFLMITRTLTISHWSTYLFGFLTLMTTSQIAFYLVNWFSTFIVSPNKTPRMDFSKGIPSESITLVIVPAILSNFDQIKEMVEALEVRFLANKDPNLHFGLLTDFKDAPKEQMPDDESFVQLVLESIRLLNEKYEAKGGGRFFLFHRPRKWNPKENKWMGKERKRGKLDELNSLLRKGGRDSFSIVEGDRSLLSQVKYVITLDADTRLPRDAAYQFIGAMSHPLNRPKFNEKKKSIDDGYAILQPRVSVSHSGVRSSRYSRLYGSEEGIDPYTRTVSDIYQDIFQEGSYIGKGIYDVDAFENVLSGRFPENLILSHDLLEGCYARASLINDVQLYEEYPSHYCSDVSRRHRWIRGDWQIMGWLFSSQPSFPFLRKKLSGLARLKLGDNFRRSLVPASTFLLLVLGWFISPNPILWTFSLLTLLLIPLLIASVREVLRKKLEIPLKSHLKAAMKRIWRQLSLNLFEFACLPYESFFSLDAIARTLSRLFITRKKLLEWNQGLPKEKDLKGVVLALWSAPAHSTIIAGSLAAFRPEVLIFAFPILVLWFFSPLLAWWVSQPISDPTIAFSKEEVQFLRIIARKTWAFFEKFVGAEDNWLPPDNYQEYPVGKIAYRTSPTNIGLSLLANLTALDFGYLTIQGFLDRTRNTLKTIENLEKYQGHLYNWYDTQTLMPLPPVYVSTVDSGNFVGHLLTLRSGMLELIDGPMISPFTWEGLNDTLGILISTCGPEIPSRLKELKVEFELDFLAFNQSLTGLKVSLEKLGQKVNYLLEEFPLFGGEFNEETNFWAHSFSRQCREALSDLIYTAPWVDLPNSQEIPTDFSPVSPKTTLRELAQWALQVSNSPDANLIKLGIQRAKNRIEDIEEIERQLNQFCQIDFSFLSGKNAKLLSIGYNLSDDKLDGGNYDLLASEARLSVFIGIAMGQLPLASWFALGRGLGIHNGTPILVSWSGSMFEYLMPLLVMPAFENTLLDQACKGAVDKQIEFGKIHGIPWGISESGYNTFDGSFNYQYRAFGVPGLGFKQGLADDLVISPYASILALMVRPEAALLNLKEMNSKGWLKRFGFYEAVDYTPLRLAPGQSFALIQSFMAHHQGMSLLSLSQVLLGKLLWKRFSSEPMFKAIMPLLQEKIPEAQTIHLRSTETSGSTISTLEMPTRVTKTPDTPVPEVQLLSNGHYRVMVTNSGGGYSQWKDLDVTRWREDGTRDNWGTFCYIHALGSASTWSITHQPTLAKADFYETIFSEGRAEFRRRDGNFDTYTEIVVSPEDDIELRRVRLTNRSTKPEIFEFTSFAEVVISPRAPDEMHPAFSKLFVQTEILAHPNAILAHPNAILASRRPRSKEEQTPWMFHLMAIHGTPTEQISHETDRAKFIGRGGSLKSPAAMQSPGLLAGSQGSVLDPIVATRKRVTVAPGQTITVDIVTGMGSTRLEVLGLIEKYKDHRLADRVFEMAWTHSQVVIRQINATASDAQLYARLASSILYSSDVLGPDSSVLLRNKRGQSNLWGYTISGDLPTVLLQISDITHFDLAKQLIQAHAYWCLKGLAVDLVIWNEDRGGYRQVLQDQISGLVAASFGLNSVDRLGGVFVQRGEQISNEDRDLFQSVARVVISDNHGTLAEQVDRLSTPNLTHPKLKPYRTRHRENITPASTTNLDLLFFNGKGGFSPDGREYVITTSLHNPTPLPWINVLANPHFGSIISENGSSYTWGNNAHEFRLTPWTNDPVLDYSGEAFFIRDEETGRFWSPTPLPTTGEGPYVCRHGFGVSVFEHEEDGLKTELTVFVAIDSSVKYMVLKISNQTNRHRVLSATGYVEWVLGTTQSKSSKYVTTEINPNSGSILAHNTFISEFANQIAYFNVDDEVKKLTCDRLEFIGRNGSLANPAAMKNIGLSGRFGVNLDPCAAIQVPFELDEGQDKTIVFKLGVGQDSESIISSLESSKGLEAAQIVLNEVKTYWEHTLEAIQIETPDPALNVMANGWLVYQTIASRFWGRSGFYQSGGAFGFRDQLQDTLSLFHAEPKLVRDHLLICTSRQFLEGDVQHWWHPPSGRGVRTHCSDDYLWLPYAVSQYVLTTGDTGLLNESISFLEGRPVNPEEDSYYDTPIHSLQSSTVYQHCELAIVKALKFGANGLPFIGSGDWNDGMNLVGRYGKGESIWLGFFFYDVLNRFAKVAELMGDDSFESKCNLAKIQLKDNLEKNGWDGKWYRRAYFDDGAVLGSESNMECQIDSISQSWSVLSEAGDPDRIQLAMDSLYQRLVRKDSRIVQLLDPPFDKSDLEPGYIKGYVPGVRENGGQYTHAAIWASMAFAKMGDSHRAWELFHTINPVNHGKTPGDIDVYKVEPYVVAADVYGVEPHIGRGGWSWYTGSAGWLYQLILHSLLGFNLEGNKLSFKPCWPEEWSTFKLNYRYRETTYRITVSKGVSSKQPTKINLDGKEQLTGVILLVDDQQDHSIEFVVAP